MTDTDMQALDEAPEENCYRCPNPECYVQWFGDDQCPACSAQGISEGSTMDNDLESLKKALDKICSHAELWTRDGDKAVACIYDLFKQQQEETQVQRSRWYCEHEANNELEAEIKQRIPLDLVEDVLLHEAWVLGFDSQSGESRSGDVDAVLKEHGL